MIVTTEIEEASIYHSVQIVDENIDLLVLITRLRTKKNIFSNQLNVIHRQNYILQKVLGTFYIIWKSKFINTLEKNPVATDSSWSELFKQEKLDPEV